MGFMKKKSRKQEKFIQFHIRPQFKENYNIEASPHFLLCGSHEISILIVRGSLIKAKDLQK